MRVCIVYATNSGGTQEAAGLVRDALLGAGHAVDLHRAYHAVPTELGTYDLVVLGSCSWDNWVDGKRLEGQLQEHMAAFLARVPTGTLSGKRVAVFGLGDSSYSTFCGAVDHLEEFVRTSGAVPAHEPLRIDGYFFALDANRKRVTDWAAGLAAAA